MAAPKPQGSYHRTPQDPSVSYRYLEVSCAAMADGVQLSGGSGVERQESGDFGRRRSCGSGGPVATPNAFNPGQRLLKPSELRSGRISSALTRKEHSVFLYGRTAQQLML